MQQVMGDVWLKDVQIANNVLILITTPIVTAGAKHDEGRIMASFGVRVGEVYTFKANDGRTGDFQVTQITSPGIAHFTFTGPFEAPA